MEMKIEILESEKPDHIRIEKVYTTATGNVNIAREDLTVPNFIARMKTEIIENNRVMADLTARNVEINKLLAIYDKEDSK